MDLADENLDPDILAQNSSQQEEKHLLEGVLKGAGISQISDKIRETLKHLGPQTLHKVVLAQEDPQVPASK